MKLSDFFKKADVLLLIFLLLLGVASIFVVKAFSDRSEAAVVTVNGELYGTYPLSRARTVTVKTEYGTNVLTIEDGKVHVSESDCTNHDCENFSPAGRAGQVIMCLPHRLVITIAGYEEPEVDAVLY